MRSISPRAVLPLALLAGVAVGCAHSPRPAGPPRENQVVTSDDIDRSPGEPLEKVLAGKVAGVVVTRTPSGGLAVQIRGATSLSGNNPPLYIVDGVPVQAASDGSLSGINPYDIERIEVLKDAASMTMYGIRGGNGVILIKTKRPPKKK